MATTTGKTNVIGTFRGDGTCCAILVNLTDYQDPKPAVDAIYKMVADGYEYGVNIADGGRTCAWVVSIVTYSGGDIDLTDLLDKLVE